MRDARFAELDRLIEDESKYGGARVIEMPALAHGAFAQDGEMQLFLCDSVREVLRGEGRG